MPLINDTRPSPTPVQRQQAQGQQAPKAPKAPQAPQAAAAAAQAPAAQQPAAPPTNPVKDLTSPHGDFPCNLDGGAKKRRPSKKATGKCHMKRTDKKVKTPNGDRVVFVGPRGGEYIMRNGSPVSASKYAKKK